MTQWWASVCWLYPSLLVSLGNTSTRRDERSTQAYKKVGLLASFAVLSDFLFLITPFADVVSQFSCSIQKCPNRSRYVWGEVQDCKKYFCSSVSIVSLWVGDTCVYLLVLYTDQQILCSPKYLIYLIWCPETCLKFQPWTLCSGGSCWPRRGKLSGPLTSTADIFWIRVHFLSSKYSWYWYR